MRLLLLLFLLAPLLGMAQGYTIRIAQTKITVDAVLEDQEWGDAELASGFRQYFPMDTSAAIAQTETMMKYDEEFIYIAARMKNLGPRKYVTPSLRRDFRGEANDGFTVVFDTFVDRTNAFLFGINPYGVQREGLVANGGGTGADDFTLNWDNKWYGAAKIHDGYWVCEMAIPFKTLRFKSGLQNWHVNFYRIDSEYAERSTWSPIPRNFDIVNLSFLKDLIWEKPLDHPGTNIAFIPYINANQSRDFAQGTTSPLNIQPGGDIKIGVGPAMNLDLTINPDFSQVEVDQQVTNLDRFEIFFPERRQFFQENADLFSGFGTQVARPFFSRRIGVARDTSTGQNLQNPIYAGARLSGKLNNKTRLGVLVMQAGKINSIKLPSTNYAVVTMQRKFWARSNVAFIGVNKQAFQDTIKGELTMRPTQFNRLLGVDVNLATRDNRWSGKIFYHRSFDHTRQDSAFATGGTFSYNTYRWLVDGQLLNVGAHYQPESGFVRRTNILRFQNSVTYNFYPTKGKIQRHGPGIEYDLIGNKQYGWLDWDVNLLYNFRMKSTAFFTFGLRRQYTYLFSSFDASGTNSLPLPANSEYKNNLFIAEYYSNARKRLSVLGTMRIGQYFNGTIAQTNFTLTWRYQPYGFLSLATTFNRIRLPAPYSNANLLLIGPRIDITFTRAVFWTTFIQYNSQIENLNINTRLQWRFKPVSDLFLVYTDNYFAGGLDSGEFMKIGAPKTRALVLKLTYWLNL